jgi:hypothetical protein
MTTPDIIFLLLATLFVGFAGYVIIAGEREDARKKRAHRLKTNHAKGKA